LVQPGEIHPRELTNNDQPEANSGPPEWRSQLAELTTAALHLLLLNKSSDMVVRPKQSKKNAWNA